jgi:hypothetical protein
MKSYAAILLALVFPICASAHDIAEEDVRKAREHCSAQYDVGDPNFDQCMSGQLRK